MERNIYHYIAWRNKDVYRNYSCLMGGFPVNSDDRLWNTPGAPFVLSLFREGLTLNYAVADEDAEPVITRIREHCAGSDSRRGYPFYEISNNGTENITDIRIDNEYYAFEDAALLKSWLEDLEGRCGEPMNDRELYDYTHPAPEPVTGDVTVVRIIEQAIVPPQPPALPVPPPDNCRSELVVEDGSAMLTVYCKRERYKYTVPAELLPRVNEAARELLAHLVNGYHVDWDPAAWITIKEREEEFDVDPEGVLQLFEELVGKCAPGRLPGPIGYRSVKDNNPVIMSPFAMSFTQQQAAPSPQPAQQAASAADGNWFCPVCGTLNAGNFCSECGSPKP